MRSAIFAVMAVSLCAGCGLALDLDPPEPVLGSDGGFDARVGDAAPFDARIDQGAIDASLPLDASDRDASGPDASDLDASDLDASGPDAGDLDAGRDSGVISSDAGPCPTGCDDAIPCTVDACTERGCTHTADDGACRAIGTPCVRAACSVTLGCIAEPTPGAPCSDGIACTTGDLCSAAGACAGATVLCGVGFVCDPTSGACRCTGRMCGTSCLTGAMCCPGDTAGSCGMCGTLRCRGDGSGYDCTDQRGNCSSPGTSCYVGSPGACSGTCRVGQTVNCNADCNWGGCYG